MGWDGPRFQETCHPSHQTSRDLKTSQMRRYSEAVKADLRRELARVCIGGRTQWGG
jgi:hypothetical protein